MLAHLLTSADSQTSYHSPKCATCGSCSFRRWALFATLSALCVILSPAPSRAVEFSVATDVFDEGVKPLEQRVTVFAKSKAVDFSLGKPNEIYVLDLKLDELTIIDESRRKMTKVAANSLVKFGMEQQALIAKMPAGLRGRLMPFLKVTWDEDEKKLELMGKDFLYSAKVDIATAAKADGNEKGKKPIDEEMVVAYRKFTDRIARYNAMRPRAKPPQSRLKLNGELAKIKAVPREIVKTTPDGTARTTHRFSSLGEKDRVRTREILSSLSAYESLELGEFLTR